jgi:hypothetical protein
MGSPQRDDPGPVTIGDPMKLLLEAEPVKKTK